ncbi:MULTISPECIES: hypothetical protein [unclassified Prochlorococcus]|uniref:hypothetical protein n=1 Tax=unclassified Prochlorococcus TaxID=2627481 RepID=UPI000533718F|nr:MULTISPECIES: hypothetical protein [unclassified Prochlorococcus]KGG15166.1 hypothetical protein EV06_1033 [Prochlorococcus sp. MIT 0602]KGG17439.1 hypothetical protein EV07_0879 [Prochlorococcus sp. MIT 0603]
MDPYRESSASSLGSLISGAILGAAGLAWWLFSEAERRQQTRKQKAMLYAPRIQDGSEAFDSSSTSIDNQKEEKLEDRVEKLNAAIADVRKQLEELGENE